MAQATLSRLITTLLPGSAAVIPASSFVEERCSSIAKTFSWNGYELTRDNESMIGMERRTWVTCSACLHEQLPRKIPDTCCTRADTDTPTHRHRRTDTNMHISS